jgi:DNA-binding transcriptional regulator GbsR (MarR family)
MAKIIIKNRYGVVPNALLNNTELTFRAKGVYAYIQSKPDGWEFSAERISAQTKEGLTAVRMALRELEEIGYLSRQKQRSPKGYLNYEYQLFDTPTEVSPTSGNPTLENPTLEIPTLENLTTYSKKEESKKDSSNKEERFEEFWEAYGKKTGKKNAIAKWIKLTETEKEEAIQSIPKYLIFRPDPTYRKDPERYIGNRIWEDEAIQSIKAPNQSTETTSTKQFELTIPDQW